MVGKSRSGCVNFSQNLCCRQLHQFCNSLFHVCKNIGMDILEVDDVSTVEVNKVEEVLRNEQSSIDTLQLLLVVLPDILPNNWFYDVIKRVCETELGIVSQCCQPIRVKACSLAYMENVALKINVKVGGRNTVIDDALNRGIRLVTDNLTIIFGADVTHFH